MLVIDIELKLVELVRNRDVGSFLRSLRSGVVADKAFALHRLDQTPGLKHYCVSGLARHQVTQRFQLFSHHQLVFGQYL